MRIANSIVFVALAFSTTAFGGESNSKQHNVNPPHPPITFDVPTPDTKTYDTPYQGLAEQNVQFTAADVEATRDADGDITGFDLEGPNGAVIGKVTLSTQPDDCVWLAEQRPTKGKLKIIRDSIQECRRIGIEAFRAETERLVALQRNEAFISDGDRQVAVGTNTAPTAALVQGDSALKGQSGFGGWGQPGLASARLQQQLNIQNSLTSAVSPFRKPEDKRDDPPPVNNEQRTPPPASPPAPAPTTKKSALEILENAEERR